MAYTVARCNLDAPPTPSTLSQDLGLQNLGLSVHVFGRGEGYDFFHNHREQEEVYFCIEGSADLRIGGEEPTTLHLNRGDVVKVEPGTLRAIGNDSSDKGGGRDRWGLQPHLPLGL